MPITRLDMITIAPKTQEATHYKHAESQKTFNEQLQISSQFSNNQKHNTMQTVKMTKSENKEYRYDAKEKGNGSYSNNSKKDKKDKENKSEEKTVRVPSSSTFDIKI